MTILGESTLSRYVYGQKVCVCLCVEMDTCFCMRILMRIFVCMNDLSAIAAGKLVCVDMCMYTYTYISS
jgi:hypothetical protein